jgi:hypothetical protein
MSKWYQVAIGLLIVGVIFYFVLSINMENSNIRSGETSQFVVFDNGTVRELGRGVCVGFINQLTGQHTEECTEGFVVGVNVPADTTRVE